MRARKSPGGQSGAIPNHSVITAGEAGPIVLDRPDIEAFAATKGAFVVLLETPGSRSRRRVFLSLAAAQRAAERARARGQSVRVVLARLDPLYQLSGTAQGTLDGGGVR